MLLRKDDPWDPELPIPDVRNWRVVDGQNTNIGFVETLVVDPRENLFEALFTGANERFKADEIEIDEHIVRIVRPLERNREPVAVSAAGVGTFNDAYRDHFESVFGDERDFSEHVAAYQFGREMAGDADFAGISAVAAKEDLEARYTASARHPPFDVVRDAVQFGYELAHETGHK
jgi:hypothetical protein